MFTGFMRAVIVCTMFVYERKRGQRRTAWGSLRSCTADLTFLLLSRHLQQLKLLMAAAQILRLAALVFFSLSFLTRRRWIHHLPSDTWAAFICLPKLLLHLCLSTSVVVSFIVDRTVWGLSCGASQSALPGPRRTDCLCSQFNPWNPDNITQEF